MDRINQSYIRFALIFAVLISLSGKAFSQTVMPEVLNSGTLTEQMNYIEERTRIYENYRAIREDMFQKIVKNSLDSLSKSKNIIIGLTSGTSLLNQKIDSLTVILATTKNDLDEVTTSKNNISVLGMEINKITYNFFMWALVGGLILILVLGFLTFKRNLIITVQTKKELADLKNEFEAYRQTTREAREKASLTHFNELKKLRGG